ncbi:MAG: hypothetical protein KAV82_07680 [Phycisphaerae bacterium]|nr:hypothetical protein [Phycisphaerae bacterium]
MADSKSKNRPAHTVRVGHCKAVIWVNNTKNGVMHSVVPVRIYRNEAGDWEETHSLSGTEILLMKEALDRAFDWVSQQEQPQQSE